MKNETGNMKKCGLLGKKLAHSYSPLIHNMMFDYEYSLYEKSEEELGEFITKGDWTGLNVTIPYKKTVIPYLDELSVRAASIGSVNTIVKKMREDGSVYLYGDNTDIEGFIHMVRSSGIDVKGKKTLVLGSGGASASICNALSVMGAEYIIISRRGENNYDNISRHYDAKIIVNTTPVGMYPEVTRSPLDIRDFTSLEAVYDIIYNPVRTELIMQANALKIPAFSGLTMLISQAYHSGIQFSGYEAEEDIIERIEKKLYFDMINIVLIGMPGCGKSSIGRKISDLTGREHIDLDECFTRDLNCTPAQYIESFGEEAFRDKEEEIACKYGSLSGKVISCGGGVVLRRENYNNLKRNGILVYINRDIDKLPTKGRPLSIKGSLQKMYEKRKPLYESFCDYSVINDMTVGDIAKEILQVTYGESD